MSKNNQSPDKNSRISRRTALKLATGSLSATAGFSSVSLTISSSNDMVEIVIERGLVDGEVKHFTKKVPKSWHEYEQDVDRTLQELRSKYESNPKVFGPSIITDQENKTKGGKKVTQLKLSIEEGYDRSNIPNSKNGVPIKINIAESDQPPGACENTSYSDMQGGVAIEMDRDGDDSKDSGFGTSGCRVANPDGNCNEYLLTVNHLFLQSPDYDCEGNWDDGIYFYNDSYYGEVYRYDQNMDYAIVDPDNESSIDAHIKDSRWDYKVKTNKTRSGLKDMISDDTLVEKMGASTGGRTGEIEGINETHTYGCVDLEGDGVLTTCDMADGDSGGPIYTESEALSDALSMCALSVARNGENGTECGNPFYSECIGTPAYRMVQDMGIEFDTVC